MEQALALYERDKSASSASSSRDSNLATWIQFHHDWFKDEEWLPLTPHKLACVASMFKQGGYRSYSNYLSRVKEEHVVHGGAWYDALDLEARKSVKSVLRGIGPPRQSADFNFAAVWRVQICLPEGAPINFEHAIVLACFFLLREIELAHLQVGHMTLDYDAKTVTLHLSVSKTDPLALGTYKTWGCVCEGRMDEPCAFHAACSALETLVTELGEAVGSDTPLFPTAAGEIVSKEAVVSALELCVAAAGGQELDKEGNRRYGGHSFRVTGARHLAALGLELLVIMALARWMSHIILHYVRDAPLAAITDTYKALSRKSRQPYTDLLGEVGESVKALSGALADHKCLLNNLRGDLDAHKEHQLVIAQAGAMAPESSRAKSVFNTNGKEHCILVGGDLSTLPLLWRTKCGWKFGTTAFTVGPPDLTAGDLVCGTCYPCERRALRRARFEQSEEGEE